MLARACGFKSRLRHCTNGPFGGRWSFPPEATTTVWRIAMRSIAFVAYSTRPDAVALAQDCSRILRGEGVDCSIWLADSPELAPVVDIYVSLGGDGTFLRAALCAHENSGEVMGVDLGRVGFLLHVAPGDVLDAVRRVVSEPRRASQRLALRGSWHDSNHVALNEFVVERAQTGRMVPLRVYLDGEEFLTYHADGVLVATPTGSTAYNFSAGGPIVATDVQAVIVTPLAPHFTIDRSAVVGANTPIEIEVLGGHAMIVCDGAVVGNLDAGQRISITRDPHALLVADDSPRDLGARLRHHLREGHA